LNGSPQKFGGVGGEHGMHAFHAQDVGTSLEGDVTCGAAVPRLA
jgi:hypothetical protein